MSPQHLLSHLSLVDPLNFWPDSAEDWIGFAVGLVLFITTIGGIFWRFARTSQKMEDKINGMENRYEEKFKEQGQRIGEAESCSRVNKEAIEGLKRKDTEHSFQIDTNSREQGRLAGEIKTMDANIDYVAKTQQDFRERVVAIETRLKYLNGRVKHDE